MSPKTPKIPGNAFDRLNATYQHLFGKKSLPQNSGTGLNRDVRDTMVSPLLRQDTIEIIKETAQLGLCTAGISEASLKIQDNTFLVTGRDSWFQRLNDKDLVLATGSANSALDEDQLPKHWDWHLVIYQENPKIKAVIIGHPPFLMALGNLKILPTPELLQDAVSLVGRIKLCQPDPADISQNISTAKILLISGVGVISCGESLSEAAANLELAEHWSEISILTSQ